MHLLLKLGPDFQELVHPNGQAYAKQNGHTDVVKLIKDWKSHVFDEVLLQLEGIQQFGDPRITLAINLIKDVKDNAN